MVLCTTVLPHRPANSHGTLYYCAATPPCQQSWYSVLLYCHAARQQSWYSVLLCCHAALPPVMVLCTTVLPRRPATSHGTLYYCAATPPYQQPWYSVLLYCHAALPPVMVLCTTCIYIYWYPKFIQYLYCFWAIQFSVESMIFEQG